MRTPMTRVMIFLYLLAGAAPPAVAQVDQELAQEFFREAQALCERDGGRLWGGDADLERVNAAMVQWFERHLGSAAK